MRILLGPDAVDRTEHARHVIKKITKQESDPQYPKNAVPIGIAQHLARYPNQCDDCGQTYWGKDEYSSHLGCRGPIKNTGF